MHPLSRSLLLTLPATACHPTYRVSDDGSTEETSGETSGESTDGVSTGALSDATGTTGTDLDTTGTDTSGSTDATTGEPYDLHGPCDDLWAKRYCTPEDGGNGVQFCAADIDDDDYHWGPCLRAIVCWPGDIDYCVPYAENSHDDLMCRLDAAGVPYWYDTGYCFTPLVLRFEPARIDAARVELTFADGHTFDISGTGACLSSDWPTPATPWLALDRDDNGAIDDARELFGSGVVLRTGIRAHDGFVALAEFDSDGDRRITPDDPIWPDLLLWSDDDGDRRSTPWELIPLAARGLTAIDLNARVDRRCDDRGNCEVERAAFTWNDPDGRPAAGEVIDLHLACQ